MADRGTLLALDVGQRRIGVAIARTTILASPLTTVQNTATVIEEIQQIITENDVATVVVGWPRGLNGQDTGQTRQVEQFVAKLRTAVGLPIVMQDEALTSVKAEAELESRHKPYERGQVDSLAATYILEDYLADNMQESHA